MQVSIETTTGLERRMKVQVPAERVEREVEQRLKSLGKRAKLNGFRPGKIPYDVVKKRFGSEVRQEVLGDLLRDTCNEAFLQEKVNPAGGPRIDSVNNEPGADLEFTATFEVYPDIKLSGTEGIQVERPVAEITEADIDAMVDNLRHQRATWEIVQRGARKGDRVQLDFNGSVNGEGFPGGQAEKVFVVLGENRMLADFERGLEGVKADEQCEFDVHFPDDYHVKEVAGKTARFKIHAHRVDGQKLPELDETFCKSFGVIDGGIEKLRAEVSENMRQEMADTARKRMKDQILDALLSTNPLQLPKALLDDEIENLRRDALERMGVKDGKKSVELPRELFEEQARRRVSLGLIIGEIISQQQVRMDAKRVQERLERMASEYSNPAEAMRSMRSNPAVMRQLESVVLEDQAVDKLLEKAAITDKPTSFQELMHFHEHPHADAHD
ncbi:MAG: trigger factor [Gammaproteobacteria bacterium]|nr:trigger factor [Gammaproteobacteria bacterium]